MNPHPSEGPDRRSLARLEENLRAGAKVFAPAPPPELRGRILDALRVAPVPVPQLSVRRNERRGNVLAVAASLLVLGGAWFLTQHRTEPLPRPAVATLSESLLGAGARVLALPNRVEGDLRSEAGRLLADTTRVAFGVVRGLPAPLRNALGRAALERM